MKSLIQAVVVGAALVAPVVSFAQANAPVTRAQVRAELVQLEKSGYKPGGRDVYYPAHVQATEAKVAAQNDEASGYGGAISGTSGAGRTAVSKADWNAMYDHP